MAEHIVAVFDTASEADAAERDLKSGGIPARSIRRYRPGETDAPVVETPASTSATGSSLTGTSTTGTSFTGTSTTGTEPEHRGGFWAWLMGEDQPHTDRHMYDEDISAGRIIMTIETADNMESSRVMRILEGHSPAELDARREDMSLEHTGTAAEPAGLGATAAVPPVTRGEVTDATTPATASATAADAAAVRTDAATDVPPAGLGSEPARETSAAIDRAAGRTADTEGREEVIPLAEEQLTVGKRTVDRGTTRIRRYVVERPVEEKIPLREETTTVERRRPVAGTTAGAGAFEERTVEVHTTSEEPVVSKTASVVEEVVVRKEAKERVETVRDTVRRDEVDVENLDQAANRTGVRDTVRRDEVDVENPDQVANRRPDSPTRDR